MPARQQVIGSGITAPARVAAALRQLAGRGLAGAALALLLAWTLAGCASLPAPAPRAETQALDGRGTPLAALAEAAAPAAAGRSAVRLLADGDHALDARLALSDRAERSLDLQYYQVASDASGLRILRALAAAGARGVRVRLLVDDLYAVGQDPLFAALAAQPNLQVRLFNPLPVRGGGFAARVLGSLHQFERINRRMHNKLLVADSALALTGGRNLGDEYFMRGAQANFIDMDVLVAGAAVAELSALFDAYWASPLAWPVAQLAGAGEAAAFAALAAGPHDTGAPAAADRFGAPPLSQQLAAGRLRLQPVAARVVADAPAKAEGRAAPADSARAQVDATLRAAEAELLIVSPYFVPGAGGMALLEDAAARGVRSTVITNSLGATDEPLVHAGYAGYREPLLRLGVHLHELGATLARRSSLFAPMGSSTGRLHAKVAVADRRWLVVGSMNMDGRSARHNTEVVLLIDSPVLAAQVAELFRGDAQASSFRLRLNTAQRIEWVAEEAGVERVHADEPDAGAASGLRRLLLAALVDEELL